MTPVPIESTTNPRFRSYQSLTSSKGIKKTGRFLISGSRIVEEALAEKNLQIQACIMAPSMKPPVIFKGPEVYFTNGLFKELDVLGTNQPLLVANCPDINEWDLNKTQDHRQVLLALQDPNNLGAALRVCEAFEISSVVLLQQASNPFHPKALRASTGSSFRLNLLSGPSIQELPPADYISLDLNGENIHDIQWPDKFRLLLGEEGAGTPVLNAGTATKIHIPIKTGMDSLNAVSALSIALFSQSHHRPKS